MTIEINKCPFCLKGCEAKPNIDPITVYSDLKRDSVSAPPEILDCNKVRVSIGLPKIRKEEPKIFPL